MALTVPLATRADYEALLPSTAERDRGCKTRRYLGLGVKEVWLLDGRRRTIEVVDLDGSCLHENDEAAVSTALPGFRITPGSLYATP